MGAADGVPQVTAALRALGRTAEDTRSKVDLLVDNLNIAVKTVKELGDGFSALQATAIRSAPGFNPISPEVLDAEGYKAGSYKPGGRSEAAYDVQVEGQLDSLADRLRSALGQDNFFAAQIGAVSGFVKEGRFSGQNAIRYLEAILWNWSDKIVSDIDNKNPVIASLAAEMERLIQSGQLQ